MINCSPLKLVEPSVIVVSTESPTIIIAALDPALMVVTPATYKVLRSFAVPFTSKIYCELLTPIPTLPSLLMVNFLFPLLAM